MRSGFDGPSRKLGIIAALVVIALGAAYLATFVAGILSLKSPNEPIRGWMFILMELLVLLTAPAMIAMMAALHAWSPVHAKATSLVALLLMTLCSGLTATVHFSILALSHQSAFTALPNPNLIFSFQWPSLAYALDILAWDVFFALAMLFAALAFAKGPLERSTQAIAIASGLFALVGLAGVPTGNMQLRNIGIIGYSPLFLVFAGCLCALFIKTKPLESAS